MKCSDCPFLENAGTYEYPEMVCQFFFCDVPEDFDSEDYEGCNLKYKEALKKLTMHIEELRKGDKNNGI